MPIYRGSTKLKAFKGTFKPINVYVGSRKLAGYTKQQQTGNTLTFNDTYNDTANITVSGNTVQQSNYYNKTGLSSQAGTPTPDAPIAITSNLPANTYKVSDGTDWYEFTLADDLRGIGTALDSVEFDRVSKTGYLRKKCGYYVLQANDINTFSNNTYTQFVRFTKPTNFIEYGRDIHYTSSTLLATFGTAGFAGDSLAYINKVSSDSTIFSRLVVALGTYTDLADCKAKLTGGKFVYLLKTPTRTALTFTKNNASTATEVPMTFLTSTPALEYPATVYDSAGVLTVSDNTSQSQQFTLPTLRKIGSIADEYDVRTGVLTKRISDWVTLDGSLGWNYNNPDNGRKGIYAQIGNIGAVGNGSNPQIFNVLGYKYNTTILNSVPLSLDSMVAFSYETDMVNYYMGIGNTDTGFNDSLIPTNAEIKAYFYGWQMCNADNTSPYYKSEVPYTPSTWAEWTSTKTITTNYFVISANMVISEVAFFNPAIKASTKYGFLWNVRSNTRTTACYVYATTAQTPIDTDVKVLAGTTGNMKAVRTTRASWIGTNFMARLYAGANAGVVEIGDIRIFELPTGSQIEADFTNLTADQLSAKYTFNGLCVKNWRKITDGSGLTSVLPTASYEGYTPYKMIYQLATPVTENLGANVVPTYYPTTKIDTVQNNVAESIIEVEAKVMDE